MKLPWMVVLLALVIRMPSCALPEMRLRSVEARPPRRLLLAPEERRMPFPVFASASAPVASVPMRLPCTRLSVALLPKETPSPWLPLMRLPPVKSPMALP